MNTGAGPASGALARLWERLGNPLEWDEVQKVLVILGVLVPASIGGLLRASYVIAHPEVEPYVSREALLAMVQGGSAYVAFAVVLAGVGLWLRRAQRSTRVYAHLANQSWWLLFAWFAYMTGLPTSPIWVIYILFGFMCLLLFDLPVVVAGMGTCLAVIFATTVAERLGWIAYAPYFAEWPEVDGRIATAWVVSGTVWPAAVSSVTFVVFALILRRARRQSERLAEMTQVLRQMFGRYMSTEVTRALLEDPGALDLGGERRTVTILMTDLRGFTALSEGLRPEQVIALLNDYFEIMIDVCLRYHGTINEIAGDALLVTFGAPQEMQDHPGAAVACAIELQNAMRGVNERNERAGQPELEMGVALNTAEVIVGNIGSERRSKYGIVGSGVNLTSRIGSYAVGGQVLASRSVVDAVRPMLRIDGEREVRPKGASASLEIYEIGGIAGPYRVAIEREEEPLVTPSKELHVRWVRLAGKSGEGVERDARVLRFSKSAMELADARELDMLDDLRLNLAQGSEHLMRIDIYGKVVDAEPSGAAVRIRYTAVPAEIRMYFEGLSAR